MKGYERDASALNMPNDAIDIERAIAARRSRVVAPERLLQLAVLEQAYDDFRGAPEGHVVRADAEFWFTARHLRGPFAFEEICEAIDFDADRIRRALGLSVLSGKPGNWEPKATGPKSRAARQCPKCTRTFTPKSHARYCSHVCRVTAWRESSAAQARAASPQRRSA